MTTQVETALIVPSVTHALTTVESLHASVMAQPNKNTVRAYQQAMNAFAKYIGADDSLLALKVLLSVDHGFANRLVQGYVTHMSTVEGLAPNSIALRVSALRTVVKDGRRFGLINWTLEVKTPKVRKLRDTAGPGFDAFKAMLAAASGETPRARRDTAILRLLHDIALRRFEALGSDFEDLDLRPREDGCCVIRVTGKGHNDDEPITVPPSATQALRDWIAVRGEQPGPLFTGFKYGRRLSGTAVWKVVHRYGKKAGVKVWPHALRHSAITRAAEKTSGDLVKVREFSRHSKVETVQIYVDRQRDTAGKVATMVGED